MPFLLSFANALTEETEVEAIVVESLLGHLKRGGFFKSTIENNDPNLIIHRLFYLNFHCEIINRIQLLILAYFWMLMTRRNNIICVNSHFGEISYFGQILASKFNCNHIITEHSSNISVSMPNSRLGRRLRISVYQSAQWIVAVGSQLASDIKELDIKLAAKIRVIGNGVDYSISNVLFSKSPKAEIPNKKRFIFVGHLLPRKGICDLVEVILKTDFSHPFELIIIGDGPDKVKIRELVKRHKNHLIDIHLLGQLEKKVVFSEIVKSDCLIMPSKYESFGIVAAEALTLGVPCIVSKSGGPEYFVRDGLDGYIVNTGDYIGITVIMNRLINGEVSFSRESVRKNNSLRFSWENVVKEYMKLAKLV